MNIMQRYCINYVFLSLKFIIKSKCQYDLFLKHLSNTILGNNTILQNTAEKKLDPKGCRVQAYCFT